jgi:tetratricopeptide (TPR) repeat protein
LALELLERDGDPWWVVATMELQAKALHMAHDSQALEVAAQALELCRTIVPRPSELEARVLERMGTIMAGRGDAVGARSYYEDALQASDTVRDLAQVARIYHGLGFCYLKMGDLGRAVDLVLKAETLYEAELRVSGAPLNMNLPRVESDLGVLFMEQGDFDRAEQRLQSALRKYSELGVDRVRSNALLSLGELRYKQGRYADGLQLVEEAVGLAQRLGEKRALGAGYKLLGELRAAQGDMNNALADFQRALVILDEAGLEERRAECLKAYDRALATKRGRADAAAAGA